MPIISVDHLTDISLETFDRAGVEPEQAQLVTRLLIKANLAGHDSHGVVRIPSYISGLGRNRFGRTYRFKLRTRPLPQRKLMDITVWVRWC